MDKKPINYALWGLIFTVVILVILILIQRYIYYFNKINISIELLENNKFIIKNKLVKFNKNSKNVALMVESRIFPNTEFIIRQFSRYLPEDFIIYIYVTDNVYDEYLDIANRLNNNINIKILPFELKSLRDYNDIMLDISFWKLFDQFDRVLIFQNDTMIYNYNISDFYKYDYIGAPWNISRQIANNVGNGGLSMRNIKAMIYCLENESLVTIPFNCVYTKDKIMIFNGKYPEDVFFSYAMLQFGYNVADINTASLFSIEEYLYNDNVLGSHKLSVYNENLYIKLLLKSIFNSDIDNVIPLKIYQTWHTKEIPKLMKKYAKLLRKQNPEFEYYLYDDNDCIDFLKNYFNPEVLWAFNQLVPGAYKADLWRYCILYINGGIYIDIKYSCINKFKLKCLLDKEYYVLDRYDSNYSNYKGIYNGLMVCKPKNPILLESINNIVINVKNNFYGINSLHPTGPLLYADMYEKYITKIDDDDFELKYSPDGMKILYNKIPVLKIYDEYRTESSFNQKVSHYGKLWKERKIYKNKNDT